MPWARGAAAGSVLLLAGCLGSDGNPLAGIDQPPPPMASADDLDDAALLRLARVAEGSENFLDATSFHRRLAARRPRSPEPRVELGRFLLRRGDVDGAEAAFREAAALRADHVDAQLGLAQVLFAQGRLEESATAFRAVAERHPGQVRALNGTGAALDGLGRRDEAQGFYRQALAAAPDDRAARHNLGLSLALGGRHDEAVAILRQLAEEPDATPAHRRSLAHALSLRNGRGPAKRPPATTVSAAGGGEPQGKPWPDWSPEQRRSAAAAVGIE